MGAMESALNALYASHSQCVVSISGLTIDWTASQYMGAIVIPISIPLSAQPPIFRPLKRHRHIFNLHKCLLRGIQNECRPLAPHFPTPPHFPVFPPVVVFKVRCKFAQAAIKERERVGKFCSLFTRVFHFLICVFISLFNHFFFAFFPAVYAFG